MKKNSLIDYMERVTRFNDGRFNAIFDKKYYWKIEDFLNVLLDSEIKSDYLMINEEIYFLDENKDFKNDLPDYFLCYGLWKENLFIKGF
jgi:hypothetical protein